MDEDFTKWLDDFRKTQHSLGFFNCEPSRSEVWLAAKELYQTKWISVDDRLPTEPKAYAVKKHGWECPFIRVWVKGNIWGDNNISPITHWMEIPK